MAQSPLGREGAQECDAVARFPPLDRVAHVALEVELINEARASRGEEGGHQEAAAKLIGNHENILRDVTNPSVDTNIAGVPLTQLELVRVERALAPHADACMREVARRLLGVRPAIHQLEERVDPTDATQLGAWVATTMYLHGRIQARAEEKPGRAPDLSPNAAEAMRAVLEEVRLLGVSTTLGR